MLRNRSIREISIKRVRAPVEIKNKRKYTAWVRFLNFGEQNGENRSFFYQFLKFYQGAKSRWSAKQGGCQLFETEQATFWAKCLQVDEGPAYRRRLLFKLYEVKKFSQSSRLLKILKKNQRLFCNNEETCVEIDRISTSSNIIHLGPFFLKSLYSNAKTVLTLFLENHNFSN